MTKPAELLYTFTVLSEFRIGGRTWRVGELFNRGHMAISHRVIRALLDAGTIEVA